MGYKCRCLVTVFVSRVQMPNPLSTAFASVAVTLKLRSSRIQMSSDFSCEVSLHSTRVGDC